MEFYSTYYKKLANYEQIKKIGEKFDQLDANDDNALNKDELANIFTGQTMTEEEKNLFMAGVDGNNDDFLTYSEFIPTFIEFDIDQDAELSTNEYELAKKRIEELEKQMEINEQYRILNDFSSTEPEKKQARERIDRFNIQRKMIYAEQDIKKKEILIGNIELKIQQIEDFIDQNTLLEFEEAQKRREIENLNAEKDLLLLKKDISVKTLNLETINLDILTKEQQGGFENELSILAQEKISKENELKISEKNLELHHKQARINKNEDLLNKFFVPEIIKENARKELDSLYDQTHLLNRRVELYSKISILSITRSQILEVGYQFQQTGDPELLERLNKLEEDQEVQQLEAQISSLRVELVDKQIQLKEVLPKSHIKPFDKVKADLEAEIEDIQEQIAELEAQL